MEISLFAAFLIGMVGNLHCIGMCGGINTALNLATEQQRSPFVHALAYNVGRISSYTIAGTLVGLSGQMLGQISPLIITLLQVTSAIMLLLIGCYMARIFDGIGWLESIGKVFWSRIQPLSKRLLPVDAPSKSVLYGMVWGWLPCGLVYSTLTWAFASHQWWSGGAIMLAFGTGTLPAMLAVGVFAQQFKRWAQNPLIRGYAGVIVMIAAIGYLWQAIS